MSTQNRRMAKPYSRPAPSTAPEGRWEHDLAPGFAKQSPSGPRNTVATLTKGTHIPNNKIIVSNLHYEVTAKDLTTIFGQVGTLTKEPVIRYDKSGRSSGVAFITYSSIAEASQAKDQFNGILAKGQPMNVVYDMPAPKRSVSAPSTASLLNRVQKPALLERLSKDDMSVTKSKAPSPRTVGPIRNRRGGAGPAAPKRSKKPVTADDLDKELDAFMKDDEEKPSSKSEGVNAPAPEKQGDVEMA